MPPQQLCVDKLIADGLLFGESPRYHNDKVYVSDMTGCTIYEIDPFSGMKRSVVEHDSLLNGIAFSPDGSLMWGSMFDNKVYRHDLETGKSVLHADLKGLMTGYCGDMVVDRAGRVYLDDIGARVFHGEKPAGGRLVMIDTDGRAKTVAEELSFPNALFIDNASERLYCAETHGWGLSKWDIAADGTLSNCRRVWATVPEEGSNVKPRIDGGCMDAEGGMWLSLLNVGKYARVDQSGTVTHEINAGGHPTACCLGGSDGKTLFLVTNFIPEGQMQYTAMVEKTTSGEVSMARVDVGRGMALP